MLAPGYLKSEIALCQQKATAAALAKKAASAEQVKSRHQHEIDYWVSRRDAARQLLFMQLPHTNGDCAGCGEIDKFMAANKVGDYGVLGG